MVVEVHAPPSFSVKPVNHKVVKVQWTKQQLKEVFKRHDVNGDGKLSREEIKKAFNDLGSKSGLYRAWIALPLADKDNDGYVSISDQELDYLVDYAYDRGYMHGD